MEAWLYAIERWFLIAWAAVALFVVRDGFLRRKRKAPYWGEPFDTDLPRWATLLLGIAAGLLTAFALSGSGSHEQRVFAGGLMLSICVPAFLLGIWYRIELRSQGLKPLYKQEVPHDPEDSGTPTNER